jgi:hypothetical protein
MAWHSQIGFDEGIMKKVDAENKKRQMFIFSVLVVMIVIVSFFVFVSSIIYLLIIFHNWSIAIGASLFLSLVVFNIYRFITITALNSEKSGIGEYHINHEKHYLDFIENKRKEEISKMPEEEIVKVVNDRKDTLRKIFSEFYPIKYKVSSRIFSMAVRVTFLSIIALVFSTGLELFIFKSHINDVLDATAIALRQELPDSWILNNMLTPDVGNEFTLFHCNSLLLIIEVLQKGLGYWKLVLDLFFLFIFLLPLILIIKSKEIQKGDYVKELALHEISISFYHYLKTQKFCVEILNQVTSEDLLERFKKSTKHA